MEHDEIIYIHMHRCEVCGRDLVGHLFGPKATVVTDALRDAYARRVKDVHDAECPKVRVSEPYRPRTN